MNFTVPIVLGRLFARPWPPLALLCAVVAMVLVGSAHLWVADVRREETATQNDLRLRISAAYKLAVSTPVSAPERDYTQSLPVVVSLDAFVQTLQRSAQAFNVSVVSVSGEPHGQTAPTLPRLDVGITLRGTYPSIKSTLGEALSRYPNAVIQQLRLKRDGASPGAEEATVQVMLPLRPTRDMVSG